jgi:ubiquinone/menaquinone biosynthesis C-methylase UbiE
MFMESSFLNPAAALRAAKLHEGLTVADLGTGSGFFARAAAREVGEDGRVWALDINPDLLPRLKHLAVAEGLHNIEVLSGDIERGCHLPAGGIDFVVMSNLLFALHDKPAAVREVKRMLKRGGRVLVIDWSGSFGGLGPAPEHVITAHDAKKLFEAEGLTFIEDIPAGEYHWGLIMKKK